MKKGFTLIELLVVITIIGILAVVFLPSIMGAPAKGRDAARIVAVGDISDAVTAGRLDGVSLPAYAWPYRYCVDDVSVANFLTYLSNGEAPLDPDPESVIDGAGGADCKVADKGKFLLRIYNNDPSGFRYGIFAKVENLGNGNIGCDQIAKSAPKAEVIGTPNAQGDFDCYGVISQ